MQCYRRLTQFKALSFDLDDTLYSNHQVMQQAYAQMYCYFTEHQPELAQFKWAQWREYRHQALVQQPDLRHNVTAWRCASYTIAYSKLGFNAEQALAKAEHATAFFLLQRSNFQVAASTLSWLAQLAKRWPLVAISNGNVDVNRIGIAPYFNAVYQANGENLCKPYPDMFHKACKHLSIKPSQLLHIGDCGHSDVFGAINAGCQAVLYQQYQVGKPLKVLPHVQISQLTELDSML